MRKIFLFLFCLMMYGQIFAQLYQDYYGAGHNQGMTISTSGEEGNNAAGNVAIGPAGQLTVEEAARFLSQATLGASYEEITQLQNNGIDAWLQTQYAMPPSSVEDDYDQIINEVIALRAAEGISDGRYQDIYIRQLFYEYVLENEDAMRMKLTFAWSQILVAWHGGLLNFRWDEINVQYFKILYNGTYGNYKDLLYNMTMSSSMGRYLSSLYNERTNESKGTLPDENFAREIMQLFSIGVKELNLDGTDKIDETGQPIPTYDNDDITELAKVFTGLSFWHRDGTAKNWFLIGYPSSDVSRPMRMFEPMHEEGEKVMLDGTIIPAGQTGLEDIEQAVDVLFNHPNVGPFLAKTMIQHMVKSNPSPEYVRRVASIFNDNGNGIRGDLKAFTTAILTDPEARECLYIDEPTNGKLIQPVERFITLFKAFDLKTPSGKIFIEDKVEYFEATGQSVFSAPSVFNFFQPDYAEEKYVAPNNLVSPEFQILNTITTISYINKVEESLKEKPFLNRTRGHVYMQPNYNDIPYFNFSLEEQVYQSGGVNALLDRLNILLCRGQLSTNTKNIIANTIQTNESATSNYSNLDAVKDAIYYVMMSPDYIIQL